MLLQCISPLAVIASWTSLLDAADAWRFEFYDDPDCSGPLSSLVAPNPFAGTKMDTPDNPVGVFPKAGFHCSSSNGFGVAGSPVCTQANHLGVKCNEATGEPFDAFGTDMWRGPTYGPYGSNFKGYLERGCQEYVGHNIHYVKAGHELPKLYVIGYMENNTCPKKTVEWEWTLQIFTTPDCSGDITEGVFSPNPIKGLSTWGAKQALMDHVNEWWKDYDYISLECPRGVDAGFAPYLTMENRMGEDESPQAENYTVHYYFNSSRCQAVPLGHFGGAAGSEQYYMRGFTSRKACPCSLPLASSCSTVTTTQFSIPAREPKYWITTTTTTHAGPAWTWQLYFDHGNCTNPAPSVTGRGDECVADLSPSTVSHQLRCISQQVYIVEFDNGHVPGVVSPNCTAIPLSSAQWYGPLTNGTTQPLLATDYATKNSSLTPFCNDFVFEGCCDSNNQIVSGPCPTTTSTTTTLGTATPPLPAFAAPTPIAQGTPASPQSTTTTYAAPTKYGAMVTPSTAAYAVPTPLPAQGTPTPPSIATYTGPVPAALLLFTPPPSMTHGWSSLTTSAEASPALRAAVAASVASAATSTFTTTTSATTTTTTTTTTTSEMPWGLPWWGWFLVCFGVLLVCLLCTSILGGGAAATATTGYTQANMLVEQPEDVE